MTASGDWVSLTRALTRRGGDEAAAEQFLRDEMAAGRLRYRYRDACSSETRYDELPDHFVRLASLDPVFSGLSFGGRFVILVEIFFPHAASEARPRATRPMEWIETEIKNSIKGETAAAFARRVTPKMEHARKHGEVTKAWTEKTIKKELSCSPLKDAWSRRGRY
jgi:hypothetical protein